MFCNIQKTEYEFSGIRILSRLKLNKGKLQKIWWIEIHSYEKNRWEKLRNIEPIPKGAVVKSLYEYGNGDLVPPFWNRVEEKMAKIQNEYSVLKTYDKFTPKRYLGKNACGMKTYRADELYRIMILQRR